MSKRVIVLVIALLAVAAVPALAATKNGITPIYPKRGTVVPQGKAATFKAKVTGEGKVWFFVCKSPKRNKDGVICNKADLQQAHKVSGTRFQARMKFYDYPSFWLNQQGTYYVQAHRIACENGTSDCLQEGPVVKFKVG